MTDWMSRGSQVDAWCATRNSILPQDRFPQNYPFFIQRAKGQFFWDLDGKRYLDYILGFGTVILGHGDERVLQAVVAELEAGVNVSPFCRIAQVELAELMVSVIPKAEMAFLMRTGSDATSAALRLARIHTGRDKVVRWGYNGWHDWSCPRTGGIPEHTRNDTLEFVFNDEASLERLFKEHSDKIACVLMMPFELEHPKSRFLHNVCSIAHQNGALFILDEMRSGFRMALGGAQEFFEVQADLATYSKAMSNGYPISAVVGASAVLQKLEDTHMSSTYYRNSAEMIAAITTIKILRDTDALARIWSLGEELMKGLTDMVTKFGINARVEGYPPCPFLRFTELDDSRNLDRMLRFYDELILAGILFHPHHHWFVSAAHTKTDIAYTLESCQNAFKRI